MYSKKDIMVNVKMGVSKSFIYQTVLLMNPKGIVLTIKPIIAFMKDKTRKLKQNSVSTLVLIDVTVKATSNI